MRVKGYELDYLFCNSVAEELTKMSVKEFRAKREKFIKDNNIQVLKYKGDDVWGGFIYDSLLELSDFLENNYVERLEDLKTDLPKTLLTKIREMKVVQKVNGRYKWIGSKNYQALTNMLLKYYVSPKKKADELINKHIKQAKIDNTYKSDKREEYIMFAYYEAESLLEKSKDENDIYYYESVKYELENYENN